MRKKAIIIVDVQECFIKAGNQYLPERIREHLNANEYNQIIFTRFINQADSNFVKRKQWKDCFAEEGTEIHHSLRDIAKQSNVFLKTTYSSLKAEGLLDFLRERKISTLYICGLNLHACVLATLFDAFDLGFDYHLLIDLTDIHDNATSKLAEKIIQKNL